MLIRCEDYNGAIYLSAYPFASKILHHFLYALMEGMIKQSLGWVYFNVM